MIADLLYLTPTTTVAVIGPQDECSRVSHLLAESSGLPVYTADEDFDPADIAMVATIIGLSEDEGFIADGTLAQCMLDGAGVLPVPTIQIIVDLGRGHVASSDYVVLDNRCPPIWIHSSSEQLAQLIGGGPGGQSSKDSST